MMNHNLLNKITEQYISDRIRENNDKIYVYKMVGHGTRHYEKPLKQIRANNRRELLIKIFEEDTTGIVSSFVFNNCENSILNKYLPGLIDKPWVPGNIALGLIKKIRKDISLEERNIIDDLIYSFMKYWCKKPRDMSYLDIIKIT